MSNRRQETDVYAAFAIRAERSGPAFLDHPEEYARPVDPPPHLRVYEPDEEGAEDDINDRRERLRELLSRGWIVTG